MNGDSTLFKLSQAYFESSIAELTKAGLSPNSGLELREADGFLCYYDISGRVIYLSMPDRDTSQGKLQMLLLRSLLACESNEEVLHLLRLILHWLVVHEIAHHIRHHYGLLSVNTWQEEQIANQLALAMSKPGFSRNESIQCHRFLERATNNLICKLEAGSSVTDSYHHLGHSLNTAGLMPRKTLLQIEQVQRQTGLPYETILKRRLVDTPPDIDERIRNRHRIIRSMNSTSAHNIVRHLYYYFGWMNIGLMSAEMCTIQDFAKRYLNHEQYV